ncbi:MAG: hypothetical protein RSP_15730 [Rhodanobacter sp.]
MDELAATRRHAERHHPDAAVTRDQFVDLVKRVSVELNALRREVSALRNRVEQLEREKRGRP